ncbi:Outer membrane protein (porin) [Roseateles sp. YR242]|uniref:porin n=1 Tax=Roseateles sp. YR242 TaxID=1855305 RepID=UPI0008C97B84|nr:porin [Roseateles sp. YR242]SEK61832.1 Outer membrane protein (porin) [Roseateles sp. YR242]
MNYKTSLCLGAAIMGSTSAWAQSAPATGSVQIYGILDQVVESVSHINAGGKESGQLRVGLGVTPSRLGFRGTEDLGGGLKANFVLETGVTADTGTVGQGSRMFGRQANVGLTGPFGTVAVGRVYAMRYYATWDADFYSPGSQGLGTLDNGIPNARIDNGISWRADSGPISGGLTYSLGRDTVAGANPAATGCAGEAAEASQCREWSAMLKYDGGTWGVVSSYERQYGGTAATYGGLTRPDLTDSRTLLNAYWKLPGDSRIGIGWQGRNNEGSTTPRSNLFWLAGQTHLSEPLVITGMLAQLKFKDSPNKAVLVAARLNYWFSKRTTIYLGDEYLKNSGTLALSATSNATGPLPGHGQNSLQLGLAHSF